MRMIEPFPEKKKVSSSALLCLIYKATVASSASPMVTLCSQCRCFFGPFFAMAVLNWHGCMRINVRAAVRTWFVSIWPCCYLSCSSVVVMVTGRSGWWPFDLEEENDVSYAPKTAWLSGFLWLVCSFVFVPLFFVFCSQQLGQEKNFISCGKWIPGFLKSISLTWFCA